MAYNRCCASSGAGIPILDARKVYSGSVDGVAVHDRLVLLRNKFAAHSEGNDLLRLTLAARMMESRSLCETLLRSQYQGARSTTS